MQSAFLIVSAVIIMSPFSGDSQSPHIQKIKPPRTGGPPNKMFNMNALRNQILIQELKHTHLDLVFVDALRDFREKLLLLAGRARKIKLSARELRRLRRIVINDDDFTDMVAIKNYYRVLVTMQQDAEEIKVLTRHPLVHYDKVLNVLTSWTNHFLVDVNGTRDMSEFYERMHLNAIKDSLGYMVLFYHMFDARKFYTTLTFNYPRYRSALYHRVEKEMPYLLDNITLEGDFQLDQFFRNYPDYVA